MLSRLSTRLSLSLAVWIVALGASLLAVPDRLQSSAYASLALLLVALAGFAVPRRQLQASRPA